MLEHYSSPEVGASLAASLVRTLATPSTSTTAHDSSRPSSSSPAHADQLPRLQQGKVLGCKLPGGQAFAFAGCPTAVAKPSLTPPPGGRSFISKHKAALESPSTASTDANGRELQVQVSATAEAAEKLAGVVNICLDGDDVVHHVAYLGSQAPAADKLANLVGLPFSYLGAALQLPARQGSLNAAVATGKGASNTDVSISSDEGAVQQQGLFRACNVSMRGVAGVLAEPEPGVYVLQQDLLAQMAEPWAQWLFQDGVSELRQALLPQCGQLLQQQDNAIQPGGQVELLNAIEVKVQHSVVQYLRNCGADLQGYKMIFDTCPSAAMIQSGAFAQG